jgi:hypothetical protein
MEFFFQKKIPSNRFQKNSQKPPPRYSLRQLSIHDVNAISVVQTEDSGSAGNTDAAGLKSTLSFNIGSLSGESEDTWKVIEKGNIY